jgi:branched-chain amino acid transport system substrate-binding protein
MFRNAAWIMAVFFLAAVWGCAPKTARDIPAPEAKKPTLADKKKEITAMVEILGAEAQKFMDQGDLKRAFFTYNKALSQEPYDPWKDKIISGIEQVLAKADPSLIQSFLQTGNLAVPESLLLYWLGVNHAHKEAYPEALDILTQFVDTWPDHPHASDAKQLIDLIKQTTFKKDTIGCLLPLSGRYAIYGQKALKGIEIALHDLSRTHGRRFNIMVKDTQGDPQKAAALVDELAQAHVMGIVGPLVAVETAGARAQELQIPLIAMTQKADFPLSGDFLFSNFITPQMQVQTLAAYVFKKLGLRKVAILFPDEPYGKLHMQLFVDAVDEYNGQVTGVEAYDGTGTDFAIPIRKLTETVSPVSESLKIEQLLNPDSHTDVTDPGDPDPADQIIIDFEALFIPDSASRINMILPQLAFNDARGMVLLGTNLWHQQSLLDETKGYNRNAVITDGYFGKSRKPATARFEEEFTALYSESPGFIEAIAYDTVQMIFVTAMDPSVDSRQRLKEALLEGRLFEGVTGNTILDSTGAARKELFLFTVKNNRFVEITR